MPITTNYKNEDLALAPLVRKEWGKMMCSTAIKEAQMPTGMTDYEKLFLHKHRRKKSTPSIVEGGGAQAMRKTSGKETSTECLTGSQLPPALLF